MMTMIAYETAAESSLISDSTIDIPCILELLGCWALSSLSLENKGTGCLLGYPFVISYFKVFISLL